MSNGGKVEWHVIAETVKPHVIAVETPDGNGTGFLLHRQGGQFWVATAAHVVRNAMTWDQVITLHHGAFTEPLALYRRQREIRLHPRLDSACVSADLPELRDDTFPKEPIEHVPSERSVKPGVEVGWLGYPYMVPGLCFFSGRVSAHVKRRYFIDGVGIPGVSGGPAFLFGKGPTDAEKGIRILGSISAYHPDRASGEALPGLVVADDCTQWPDVVRGA